jgi:hypothetical protein
MHMIFGYEQVQITNLIVLSFYISLCFFFIIFFLTHSFYFHVNDFLTFGESFSK